MEKSGQLCARLTCLIEERVTGTDRMRVHIIKMFLPFSCTKFISNVSSGLSPALTDPCVNCTLCSETLCLLSGIWRHLDWFWIPTIWRSLLLPPAGWSVCNVHIYVYTGCPRRYVPDFGRVFLMLKYTDITQNT